MVLAIESERTREMKTYTVIGVWMDCEAIPVATIEGDHMVSNNDAHWSEGTWAVAVDGEDDIKAEAKAVADQQKWHDKHAHGEDTGTYRYNEHSNDLGDWCPYSLTRATVEQAEAEDERCPQGCRGSFIEDDPDAKE